MTESLRSPGDGVDEDLTSDNPDSHPTSLPHGLHLRNLPDASGTIRRHHREDPQPSRAVHPALLEDFSGGCHGAQRDEALTKMEEKSILLQSLSIAHDRWFQDLTWRQEQLDDARWRTEDELEVPLQTPVTEDWEEYRHLNWKTGFNIHDLFGKTRSSASPQSERSCHLNVCEPPEVMLQGGPPRSSPLTPAFEPEEELVEEEAEAPPILEGMELLASPTMEGIRQQLHQLLETPPVQQVEEREQKTGVSPAILAWQGASPIMEGEFQINPNVEY